jgi:hypothetical protein
MMVEVNEVDMKGGQLYIDTQRVVGGEGIKK